jgi:tRNA G10  N-methylase Trm11
MFISAQKEFFDRLGGSQKLYEVLTILPEQDWRKKSSNWIKEFFSNQIFVGKLAFGISVYSSKNEKKFIFSLGKEIKSLMRLKDINSRFIPAKDNIVSTASAKKNQLTGKNLEIAVIPIKGKVAICKLLNIQDFELFAKIDYLRPSTDPLSGMLPPKLARSMINLAGQASNDQIKIIDPFVGSGMILIQAALLGYKNLFGSDISGKAISDTEKNLEWLKKEFSEIDFTYQLAQLDVLKLKDLNTKFDLIISEGYLGPPLKLSTKKEEVLKIKKQLEEFYNSVLSVLAEVISEDGRIVLALPFFYIDGKEYLLDLNIAKGLQFMELGGLKYRRKEQFVGRHIFQLKKG